MKPYYEDGAVTIYLGDCMTVSVLGVDVIITDPPYGSGCAPRGGRKAGTVDLDSGFREPWDTWPSGWCEWWSGPLAAFCHSRFVFACASELRADGMLLYIKSNPSPFGSSYEPCLTRGFHRKCPQHFTAYNATNGQQHPTEKPLSIMRWVVSRSPEGTILDPFMGSGTTLRAAKDLGRKAIGIEIEERYCEIAAKRMAQEVLL